MYSLVGEDTVLTTAWKQSTPFHGVQYGAQNGNMRNFGATNPNDTAFAPKQWLYQKKATGMESSKMYRPSRLRYRTHLCLEAKYPILWEVVLSQEWKHAKLRPYQSPWYRVCSKEIVISKGSNGHGEFKNVLPQSVKIPCLLLRGRKLPRFMAGSIEPRMEICERSALPIPMVPGLHQSNAYINRKLRAWRVQKYIPLVGAHTLLTTAWTQTTQFHGVQYREQNGNIRNFDRNNPNGTAFAPKQWLYQKEATGIESSRMYRPSRLRYRTHHCVEAKYPVLWEVVQSQELKQAKLRPYQSPWYRVCTKAMVI